MGNNNIYKDIKENAIDVSIIIPCKNEVNNLKWTVDSILKSKNSLCFEIIVIDDASNDGSTEFLEANFDLYKNIVLIKTSGIGIANARNKGAEHANGKYLFFCDAHIKVPNGWLDDLINTLQSSKAHLVAPAIEDIKNPLVRTYGVTWNYKFQAIWIMNKPISIAEVPFAGCAALCITKEVFNKIHGFNYLFQGYGVEDQELCLKAWLYGYKLVVNPNIRVKHLFRRTHNYKINPSNSIFNTLCLAYCHFDIKRISKIIDILKDYNSFYNAVIQVKKNQNLIFNLREKCFNERLYDDKFFFNKFNIIII